MNIDKFRKIMEKSGHFYSIREDSVVIDLDFPITIIYKVPEFEELNDIADIPVYIKYNRYQDKLIKNTSPNFYNKEKNLFYVRNGKTLSGSFKNIEDFCDLNGIVFDNFPFKNLETILNVKRKN